MELPANVDRFGAQGTYDSWADRTAGYENLTVNWAALIVDSGAYAGGDQVVNLTSATFNGITFNVPGASTGNTVCPTQQATIRITKQDAIATTTVNEPLTVQPKDDNGIFRVVDCKYMYNLASSSLSGTGTYRV